MIPIRKYLLPVTFIFFPLLLSAQDITMEETLSYINRKLGNSCTVDVERGVIIAKFKDGEEIYRVDQALCKDIDRGSMQYNSKDRIFSMNCLGNKKCVDRQLFVRKIQRDYSRISFPVSLDAKSAEGMRKAFNHMILLVLDPKYKSSEPFE